MVPKLEVCSVCKALLDEYADRRKREKEEVYKVQSRYRHHCTFEHNDTLVVDSIVIITAPPSV